MTIVTSPKRHRLRRATIREYSLGVSVAVTLPFEDPVDVPDSEFVF
jgi:hypothetical protein